MGTKNLDILLRKREQLEREIAEAQRLEKRKNEVMDWPEFDKILFLPDEILRASLARIADESAPAT